MLTCRLRTADTPATIERLVASTMAQFGSVQEFVESFAAHFQRLRTEKPLSRTLTNYYLTMLKLTLHLEEQPRDTSDLSDEELRRRAVEEILDADDSRPLVLERFLQILVNEPEPVTEALRALGWTVTLPMS